MTKPCSVPSDPVEAALGMSAADVVAAFAVTAETFAQLAAMFSYLHSDLAGQAGIPARAGELAEAGERLAGQSADLLASLAQDCRKNQPAAQ